MEAPSFGLGDEAEINILAMLKDPKVSDADRRGALVEEVLHRLQIVTLEDTDEILFYKDGVYLSGGEQKIRAELQSLAGFELTNHMRAEVLSTIRAMTYMPRSAFDSDPAILNLKNGLLNVETNQFTEHRPEYLSLSQMPVKYDPKATCPNIIKFLTDVLDNENLKIIVRLLGYILYRTSRYEKAFMLVGEGANGKTTFIRLIVALAGTDNVSSVSLQDLTSDRFAAAGLYCKMINVYADLRTDKITDSGYFKTLVSGDRMRVQHKHQQPFNMENYAKLVFSANQIPETDDKSYSYYRRWVIIPFNRTFEGAAKDEQLIDKLTTEQELSGLLNIALVGLKRLKTEGGFDDTDLDEIRQQYELGASSFQDFLEECCILDVENPELMTLSYDLQAEFSDFCKKRGSNYVDIRKFGEKLKALGVKHVQRRIKGNKSYVYIGIAIKRLSVLGKQPTSGLLQEKIIVQGDGIGDLRHKTLRQDNGFESNYDRIERDNGGSTS